MNIIQNMLDNAKFNTKSKSALQELFAISGFAPEDKIYTNNFLGYLADYSETEQLKFIAQAKQFAQQLQAIIKLLPDVSHRNYSYEATAGAPLSGKSFHLEAQFNIQKSTSEIFCLDGTTINLDINLLAVPVINTNGTIETYKIYLDPDRSVLYKLEGLNSYGDYCMIHGPEAA